jgi:hypothetical protein
MTSAERKFFQMVDKYSRNCHKFFVAEMDLEESCTEYRLCFRPMNVTRDSPHRYACRYLTIAADEVRTIGKAGVLSASFVEELDNELTALRASMK